MKKLWVIATLAAVSVLLGGIGISAVGTIGGHTTIGTEGTTDPCSTIRVTHDSVSEDDHCGFFERLWWGAEECCQKDDKDHNLEPCKCFCPFATSETNDCTWERIFNAPGGSYEVTVEPESTGACGPRGGTNDKCGKIIPKG